MARFCHGDQSLYYLVRGRGEWLLLIHGLGSSGADWAMQVAALERRFRLIVPDLPGCGHSGSLSADCSIAGFAGSLWALLDHLEVEQANIAGFSLGGAVALEMALQRPDSVPRLALINSLASYRVDHWRKWLEARVSSAMVSLLGMQLAGRLFAARLFPHPWQQAIRERAARVVGAVPPRTYLGLMQALERWSATDRLGGITSRTMIIAAEHDFVPLADTQLLASRLRADLVMIYGSHHGTPFDSVKATNASLLALLTDQALSPAARWACDEATLMQPLAFDGSLAEEHALGA